MLTPTTLPAYDPAANLPPPAPLSTLTISPRGVLYLHKAVVAALGLRVGQAIGLCPPAHGSPYWHLDLRPEAPQRIDWYGKGARVRGLKLPPGLLTDTLVLCLLPGEPHYPHFHPLLPAHAFAPQTK